MNMVLINGWERTDFKSMASHSSKQTYLPILSGCLCAISSAGWVSGALLVIIWMRPKEESCKRSYVVTQTVKQNLFLQPPGRIMFSVTKKKEEKK